MIFSLGASTGPYQEPFVMAAAEEVLDYLHRTSIYGQKIILWGYSLGGSICVHLASKFQHKVAFLPSALTGEIGERGYVG